MDTKITKKELIEVVEKLWVKVETLNERTKRHTKDIQELRREIKQPPSSKPIKEIRKAIGRLRSRN